MSFYHQEDTYAPENSLRNGILRKQSCLVLSCVAPSAPNRPQLWVRQHHAVREHRHQNRCLGQISDSLIKSAFLDKCHLEDCSHNTHDTNVCSSLDAPVF